MTMIYEFADFTYDEGEGLLRREGQPMPLRAQPIRVLAAFLKSGGRLLSKQKLVDLAWQGRAVSDDAVYAQIRNLRKVLGDTEIPHRMIETLHGQGFQMLVPVTAQAAGRANTQMIEEDVASVVDGPPRIAILPFEPRGEATSPLAQGLADDTIDALSRLQSLAVISRLSSFSFSEKAITSGELAGRLRADYALAGTVEQQGGQVRIHVGLTDLADQTCVWSEGYETTIEGNWEVRRDIAGQLAHALDTRIMARQAWRVKLRDPAALSAWQNYHLGMDDMFSGVPRKADSARASFLRALEIDPNFVRAHAAMSQVSWWQMMAQPGNTEILKAEVGEHAASAIASNRLDPFANFVMGRAQWLSEGPDAGAAWFERAVAISPSYAHALGSYANYLSMDGQAEKAFVTMGKAINLSPADPQLAMMYAVMSVSKLLTGESGEAAKWARKALAEPMPSLMVLQGALMAFHEAGHAPEAARVAEMICATGIPVSSGRFRKTLPIRSPAYIDLIDRSLSAYGLGK